MPRIRSIKPEFWTSERLATRLPGPDGRQARLLFIALWNLCEDHGVCRGSPALLRGAAFPYDDDVSPQDVDRWLGLLDAGGFLVRYEVGGSHYIHVRGFVEHQVINRPSKPTLPLPPENEPSVRTHGGLTEDSRQERKGKEGSGKELFPASRCEPDADGPAEPFPERPPLSLEVQQPKPPTRKREKPPDPRHATLVKALCEAAPGYTFLGGPDAAAVTRLLELAGEDGPEEVVRRWRICRAWVGWPQARHLNDFAASWNHYAKPQAAAQVRPGRFDTTPSDFSQLPEGGIELETFDTSTGSTT